MKTPRGERQIEGVVEWSSMVVFQWVCAECVSMGKAFH